MVSANRRAKNGNSGFLNEIVVTDHCGRKPMRYVLCGLLAALCFFGRCPPPDPLANLVLAMIIQGPTSISAAKGPVPYTIIIGSGGKPANVGYNPFTAPLYLEESDGTLMTFMQGVNLPPGVNSQTLTLKLSCTRGMVGGDAFTFAAGTPNNPISTGGASRPAVVAVNFLGKRYDGSRGDAPGNTVSITCLP
jgi:hypothetical protein